MLKPCKGISTREFMSPRGRLALLRDYSPNCVDLIVLSYTQIPNVTKQFITGSHNISTMIKYVCAIATSNNFHLGGVNRFLKDAILQEFYFVKPRGWCKISKEAPQT